MVDGLSPQGIALGQLFVIPAQPLARLTPAASKIKDKCFLMA